MTKISNQYSLTNILTADLANSRLGINNVSPTVALDVTGAGKFSGTVTTGGATAIADALLPIQINAVATTGQAYFASNNNGSYGLLMGYDNANGYARIRNVSNTALTFETNNTEKVRITSAGNVGIGTTAPSDRLNVVVGSNGNVVRFDGPSSGLIFQTNATTTDIISYGGSTPAYRALNFSASASTNMTITTGGNLGIGTSNPATLLSILSSTASSSTLDAIFNITNDVDSNIRIFVTGSTASDKRSAIGTTTNTALAFLTNNTERMRIDSNGNVYIGTTDPNATNFGMALLANGEIDISRSSGTNFVMNRSTTNGQIIDFRYNNTQVGSISTNSNSLPSDLNFKKDISEISIGLNLVNKLRPVHYRHKLDEDNEALSNGIIAQELEQSLLDCGIEKNTLLMLQHKPNEKENESQYWVDYTKMIPILIKAIQELSAKVSLLENK